MRVCLDISAVRRPITGIGRYAFSLASHLRQERELELYCYTGAELLELNAATLMTAYESATTARRGANPALLDQLARIGLVRRIYRLVSGVRFSRAAVGMDLFHATSFVAPRETGMPVLPLIYDLSFERMPDAHPPERVAWLRSRLSRLERFAFINTISQFSANEIAEVYRYPRERIVVTEPGVDERLYGDPPAAALAQIAAMGLSRRCFFLAVGTLEPRKNHQVIIEAFSRLPRETRQACPLVIVGANGWGSVDVTGQDKLVQEGSVRFLGYLNDDVVHALYATARAFLFSSLYEGFGMPVAEAMACGLQPIVSDIAVMREVAGEWGIYIDPNDSEAWRAALIDAATNTAHFSPSGDLVSRGRSFNWKRTAEKTVALYRMFE